MAKYEVKYIQEAEFTMIVEANSEAEAKMKYENFDYISNYETQGISMELKSIEEKDPK